MPKKFLLRARNILAKLLGGRGLGRFRLYAALREKFYSRIHPSVVSVHGLTFSVLGADGILPSGGYQRSVVEIFRRELRPGDTVADVGANTGFFACLAAKFVGQNGRVYAFEPEPKSLSFLQKNVAANGFQNVTVVPKAVAEKSGTQTLFLHGAHSSLGHNWFQGGVSKEVEVISIDDFFRNVPGRIDFIKLNIIGSEAAALRGMARVLRENRSVKIVSIFNPVLIKMSGGDPRRFLETLGSLGFTIYNIDKRGVAVPSAEFDALIAAHSPARGINPVNIFAKR